MGHCIFLRFCTGFSTFWHTSVGIYSPVDTIDFSSATDGGLKYC